MWGEALRVVADIQPKFFLAENPIGILNHDGGRTFRGLLRALASVGYICEWDVIAAAHVGAPHRRDRVWLVAHADSVSRPSGQPRRALRELSKAGAGSQRRQNEGEAGAVLGSGSSAEVAGSPGMDSVPVLRHLPLHDSQQARSRLQLSSNRGVGVQPVQASHHLADADGEGLQGTVLEHSGEGLPRPRSRKGRNEKQDLPQAARGWWEIEPDVGRMAHGIPSRVDRLRCLGNAVVPQVVEIIGRAIMEFAS
jgi:DNA (cytosine-5)-methyltransferase 1